MGYGIILGSGGGAALNYSWVNASSLANLPSGKPANTLGFITSTAAGKVYWKNSQPTGLVTGDVVMKEGPDSSTPFNVLSVGQLWLYPIGAWQYNGSILVPIDVYWNSGSAWIQCCIQLYELGSIHSLLGGLGYYRSGGDGGGVANNGTYVSASTTWANFGWGYWTSLVNLTNFSKLKFSAYASNAGGLVGVVPTVTSQAGMAAVTVNAASYSDFYVDVSALNGNYWIIFGINYSTGAMTTYVRRIWGM